MQILLDPPSPRPRVSRRRTFLTDITIRDQYKRLLAYVYAGEMLVNLEMVRQGQAVIATVAPNVAHVEEYRKAQSEAREAGRGVWDREKPLDINP